MANPAPSRDCHNILELGRYVAPAFAGMVLAEQGHKVWKWWQQSDPILSLNRGEELWDWINAGKNMVEADIADLKDTPLAAYDIVLDNLRPSYWERIGCDRKRLAEQWGLVWVSLCSEVGDTSFDVIAQARSWMEYGGWVPFYVGDTVAGLWMAFAALAQTAPGHYEVGHASCMQKLVEGELAVVADREGGVPWDTEAYYADEAGAHVEYRGRMYHEPVRFHDWKLSNLWHEAGRLQVPRKQE